MPKLPHALVLHMSPGYHRLRTFQPGASVYILASALIKIAFFVQNHPNQRAPIAQGSNAKCLLWDEVETRHAADVKAAAEAATQAYREAHPDVDEAAIKVDIPVAPPPKPPQAPPPAHVPLFGLQPLAGPAQFVNYHAVPRPMVQPVQGLLPPPNLVPNMHGGRRGAAAMRAEINLGVLPPPPPAPPLPQLDPQIMERHRHALALEERERKAHQAAVRQARKEAQRERKAERARMQAMMQAQMQAMEEQREYGRRQMALEMQREQAVRAAAAAGHDQTFGAPPMAPGQPVKRARHHHR